MKRHIFLLPLLLSAVAGCSGMADLLSFGDVEEAQPAPVAVQSAVSPVPAQDSQEAFCRSVAASDGERFARNGFDEATRQRMTSQSYQQCLAMSGSG